MASLRNAAPLPFACNRYVGTHVHVVSGIYFSPLELDFEVDVEGAETRLLHQCYLRMSILGP